MAEILREAPVIVDRSHKRLMVTDGEIAFHDVNYAYRDAGSHDVIHSLNLTIPASREKLVWSEYQVLVRRRLLACCYALTIYRRVASPSTGKISPR